MFPIPDHVLQEVLSYLTSRCLSKVSITMHEKQKFVDSALGALRFRCLSPHLQARCVEMLEGGYRWPNLRQPNALSLTFNTSSRCTTPGYERRNLQVVQWPPSDDDNGVAVRSNGTMAAVRFHAQRANDVAFTFVRAEEAFFPLSRLVSCYWKTLPLCFREPQASNVLPRPLLPS